MLMWVVACIYIYQMQFQTCSSLPSSWTIKLILASIHFDIILMCNQFHKTFDFPDLKTNLVLFHMLTTPTSKYENEQNAKIPCKVSPTPAIELREIPSTWKSAPGSFCPISIHTTFKKKTCNEIRIFQIYDLTKNPVSEIMHHFISQERDIVSDPLMYLQH